MDKRMLRRGVVIVMIMICIVSLSFTPIWTKADNVNAISLRKEGDAADIVDIKYALHAFLSSSGEQIYCYSAMIIYRIYK